MTRNIFFTVWMALSLTTFQNDQAKGMDPFNNGSNKRNQLVVISDLHMGADLSYAELNKNATLLEKFLKNIRSSTNVRELVIGGDLLDEWFVPADVNTYNGKDQRDFVKRLATSNHGILEAFNNIIKEGKIKLTYVPGNHDITLTPENVGFLFPGISQARDKELGLGTYSPQYLPQLAIEHGHRYNFFCAPDMLSNQDIAPGTILPPGYFFTRIAALHVRENCKKNLDEIPPVSLNPQSDQQQKLLYIYSQIWKWAMEHLPVNNHFDENVIVTNVNGFSGSYSINDLLPTQAKAGGEIKVKLYNDIQNTWNARQTNNHVAVNIPVDHAIAFANSADETDDQAVIQYFKNKNSDKRIVIFGHNHRATIKPYYNPSGLKSIYANSGTWIDHNPDSPTATFILVTPQGAEASSLTSIEVYSFEKEVYTQLAMNTVRL